MAFDFREIKLNRDAKEEQFRRKFEAIPAVFCTATGVVDNESAAHVVGRPGYCWYLMYGDLTPSQVLNRGSTTTDINLGVAPSISGMPVSLGYREDSVELEVLSVYQFTLPPSDTYVDSEYSSALDSIDRRQLLMLKTTASSGLLVNVSPLEFDYDTVRYQWPGQIGYDLSASVPGAGLTRFTLVYLDASTNALAVVDGTTIADNPFVVPTKPNTPSGGIASAYIRLTNGLTTIDESLIDDGRRFLTLGAGAVEQPTQVGEVLFSVDGTSWTRELPVTGPDGWLVNDDGILLVVG